MKKTLGLILIVMLAVAGPLAAQGASEKASTPEVYFLNFKPEIATVYTDTVAPAFEAETGIKLKVVTAASNQYATTLKSEMATSNPPVIFQTNGPVGLQGSRTDVAPLENTEFYKILADKSMALSIDGHVAAIPYAVEGYGIIYNQAIMNKYFATAGAKATSMDQIKDFATLKAVVEDMTAKKSQLGIKACSHPHPWLRAMTGDGRRTCSTSPLSEFADKSSPRLRSDGLAAKTFDFTYADQYKQLFDLYLNNSDRTGLVGSKSVDDSMAEDSPSDRRRWFRTATGEPRRSSGCRATRSPTATSSSCLCTWGFPVKRLWAVRRHRELPVDQQTCVRRSAGDADKFLTWLFSSATGKIVKEQLGFITPFNTFSESEMPSDPLAKQVVQWMNKDGVSSIPWTFSAIPSEQWKSDFGGALLQYIQGSTSWANVVKTAQDSWTKEAKIAGR